MDEMETPPTHEAILKAAIMANVDEAIREGRLLEMLEAMPSEVQATIIEVMDEMDTWRESQG